VAKVELEVVLQRGVLDPARCLGLFLPTIWRDILEVDLTQLGVKWG
jgi:hypothetical protein